MKKLIGVGVNFLWLVGLYLAATSVPELTGLVVSSYLILTLLYLFALVITSVVFKSGNLENMDKLLPSIFEIAKPNTIGKINNVVFYLSAITITSLFQWWFTFSLVVVNMCLVLFIKSAAKDITKEFVDDPELGQEFVDLVLNKNKEK